MVGLDRKVASAARWSLINTILMRIGTFGTGVVLARYFLGPAEWGLYAVGLLTLTVLLSVNEMGVSLAIVRWPGEVREFAPTVLTLSTLSSVILYVLLFLAAFDVNSRPCTPRSSPARPRHPARRRRGIRPGVNRRRCPRRRRSTRQGWETSFG